MLHESRLRRILTVMANHRALVAILGAFRNPPAVAAAARGLPAFRKTFRIIEFAVFCRPDTPRTTMPSIPSSHTSLNNTTSYFSPKPCFLFLLTIF